MRIRLLALASLFLFGSGCIQATDNPPPSNGPPAVDCPLAAEVQEGTVNTEIGEYNVSGGASSSYDEFEWDWPSGSLIAMHVEASWDAGALGEKAMQLRVATREDYRESFATAHGPSPILLNATLRVPDEGRLVVVMEPRADTAGVGVSKASVDTRVTMVQTLLCEP